MAFSSKIYLIVALVVLVVAGLSLINLTSETQSLPTEAIAPAVAPNNEEIKIPPVVEPEKHTDAESPVFPALPAGRQVKSPIELLNEALEGLKTALIDLQANTKPQQPPVVVKYHTAQVMVNYQDKTADILYRCDSECFLIDRFSGKLLQSDPLLGEGKVNVSLDKPVLFGLVVGGKKEGNGVIGGNLVAVGETSYGPSTFQVSSGAPAALAPDTVPPAKVTNLTLLTGCFAEDGGTFKISSLMFWTAPGDDGNIGTVTRYDIRYRLGLANNITPDNYNISTLAPGNPTPKSAGSSEAFAFLVTGLSNCDKISIALTALDDASNRSEMSNEVNNY